MRIHRILRAPSIRLAMKSDSIPEPPETMRPDRAVWYWKERILEEIAEVLDLSGDISSRRKLYHDLLNRERQATSAVGEGIAIPHVRTLQARRLILGFCRSAAGLPFAAIDGEPVRLFFPMVAPPHDDRTYLKIYKELVPMLRSPECRAELIEAETPDEAIHTLQRHSPW